MAQQLRALNALLAVLSSNPSNYMVAHNHLYSYSVLIYIKSINQSINQPINTKQTHLVHANSNLYKNHDEEDLTVTI